MECKKITPYNYQLCITYRDYVDRLKDSHPLLNETIEMQSDPRIPFTVVMGNRVVIGLKSTILTRHGQKKLKKLVNYLEIKTEMKNWFGRLVNLLQIKTENKTEDLDVSGIVYSVKEDSCIRVNEIRLTRQKLESLVEFTTKKFYQFRSTNSELLQISTKPIPLKKYFRPLFEKLAEIKDLGRDRYNGYFQSLTNLIVKEILKRVELGGSKTILEIDYLDHLKFLQKVSTSFLLNKQELSDYLDELVDMMSEDKMKSEIVRRCNYRKRFEDDWEVKILFKVKTTSSNQAFQRLKNNIKLAFDIQGFPVNKFLLTKNFSDEIHQELSYIRKDLDNKMRSLQSYEDFLKQNIDVDFSVDISVERGERNVFVCPMKNGVLMVPACPILTRPENIRMIDVSSNYHLLSPSISEKVVCVYFSGDKVSSVFSLCGVWEFFV